MARFFTQILSRAVRVVRANRERARTLPAKYQTPGASNLVAGADGYAFTLARQSSLDHSHRLNDFPIGTVPLANYRANIEVGGDQAAPYDEDYWRLIGIGQLGAAVVKACLRCRTVNVGQATGVVNPYIGGLAVLRDRKGMVNGESGIVFALNLNHVYVPGQMVSVGDPVVVLERASQRNVDLAFEPAI